jgi:ribonuclease P protein component
MSGTGRNAFPRSLRIGRSSEFRRLKEEGKREVSGCLVMNWAPAEHLRLGVVTSRKVGAAVGRSRARRWIREAFRVHQHEFRIPVDLVLVARPSIARCDFVTVERDFLNLITRARLRQPAGTPPS